MHRGRTCQLPVAGVERVGRRCEREGGDRDGEDGLTEHEHHELVEAVQRELDVDRHRRRLPWVVDGEVDHRLLDRGKPAEPLRPPQQPQLDGEATGEEEGGDGEQRVERLGLRALHPVAQALAGKGRERRAPAHGHGAQVDDACSHRAAHGAVW